VRQEGASCAKVGLRERPSKKGGVAAPRGRQRWRRGWRHNPGEHRVDRLLVPVDARKYLENVGEAREAYDSHEGEAWKRGGAYAEASGVLTECAFSHGSSFARASIVPVQLYERPGLDRLPLGIIVENLQGGPRGSVRRSGLGLWVRTLMNHIAGDDHCPKG
jgi:hypothetical protein